MKKLILIPLIFLTACAGLNQTAGPPGSPPSGWKNSADGPYIGDPITGEPAFGYNGTDGVYFDAGTPDGTPEFQINPTTGAVTMPSATIGSALLADIQAKAIPADGTTIYMTGRTANGDGGEGTFIFDDSDLSTEVTADALHGAYIPPTSDDTGASGAWVRAGHGEGLKVSVRWFGATGDGTTDDTAAIQAALNLSNTVYVDNGTYITSSALTKVSRDFVFEGESPDAIIRNSASNIIEMKTTFGTYTHNVRISNMTLDGVSAANGFTGLDMENIQFSYLQNVTFNNLTIGARLASCYSDSIRDCVAEDCTTGFYFDRRSEGEGSVNVLRFTNNYIESCTTGVNVVRLGANNLIEANEFNRCGVSILQGDTGSTLSIKKNFFENGTSYDVRINSSIVYPMVGLLIEDNYFGTANTDGSIARIHLNGVSDAKIMANGFKEDDNDNILCQAVDGVANCIFDKNILFDTSAVLQPEYEQVVICSGSHVERDVFLLGTTSNLIASANQISPLTAWDKYTGGTAVLTTESIDTEYEGKVLDTYHIRAQRVDNTGATLQHTLDLSAVEADTWITFSVIAYSKDETSEFRLSLRVNGGGGFGSSALITPTIIPKLYSVTKFFESGQTPEIMILPGDTSSTTNPDLTYDNNIYVIVGAANVGKAPMPMQDMLLAATNKKVKGFISQSPDGSKWTVSVSDLGAIDIDAFADSTF